MVVEVTVFGITVVVVIIEVAVVVSLSVTLLINVLLTVSKLMTENTIVLDEMTIDLAVVISGTVVVDVAVKGFVKVVFSVIVEFGLANTRYVIVTLESVDVNMVEVAVTSACTIEVKVLAIVLGKIVVEIVGSGITMVDVRV